MCRQVKFKVKSVVIIPVITHSLTQTLTHSLKHSLKHSLPVCGGKLEHANCGRAVSRPPRCSDLRNRKSKRAREKNRKTKKKEKKRLKERKKDRKKEKKERSSIQERVAAAAAYKIHQPTWMEMTSRLKVSGRRGFS